jgi:hypothetical protein
MHLTQMNVAHSPPSAPDFVNTMNRSVTFSPLIDGFVAISEDDARASTLKGNRYASLCCYGYRRPACFRSSSKAGFRRPSCPERHGDRSGRAFFQCGNREGVLAPSPTPQLLACSVARLASSLAPSRLRLRLPLLNTTRWLTEPVSRLSYPMIRQPAPSRPGRLALAAFRQRRWLAADAGGHDNSVPTVPSSPASRRSLKWRDRKLRRNGSRTPVLPVQGCPWRRCSGRQRGSSH